MIDCEVMLCLDEGDKLIKRQFNTEDDADKWVQTFLSNERFVYGGTDTQAWFSGPTPKNDKEKELSQKRPELALLTIKLEVLTKICQ